MVISDAAAPADPVAAKCSRCGHGYPLETSLTRCRRCGGVLLIRYNYNQIAKHLSRESLSRRIPSVWKYSELLPIRDLGRIVSLGEGGTYLHECSRLVEHIGVRRILIKDETTNPTASFVDRGCTVAVSKAVESGAESICCGATGNMGASLSAYAAKAGIGAVIFLPKSLDVGKLYQMIAFGAKVELTPDYESAVARAERFNRQSLLITTHNPYFMEGEKTTGYEIVEQMGWRLPDRVIVPMGSGGHLAMIKKALDEFSEIGLIDSSNAKMTGVQAAAASPIVDAYRRNEDIVEGLTASTATLAHDISIESPSAGDLALAAIRSSRGDCAGVTDHEILEAASLLAKREGIFAEPAAASTIAGLKKLVETGVVGHDEEVICVITGAGLKDPVAARRFAKTARSVEVAIRSVEDRSLTTRLGTTKLKILEILSGTEAYGYQIRMQLVEQFGIAVKIPVVYQHLKELEGIGLVRRSGVREVSGRPERQYYILTEKGRVSLERFRS